MKPKNYILTIDWFIFVILPEGFNVALLPH